MLAELSATEIDNQRRFGCSVAESVVGCYALADQARADGDTLVAILHDVSLAEVERVAQLSGALIDAGCSIIRYLDTGQRTAELRAALQHARIADERIDIVPTDL